MKYFFQFDHLFVSVCIVSTGGLEERSHHATRPAPWSPKIHHERHLATREMQVESLVGQDDRMPGEQRLLAFSATGSVRKTGRWDPVRGLATWANDDFRLGGHDSKEGKSETARRLEYRL